MRRKWSKNRCPHPDCRNKGRHVGMLQMLDLCATHDLERAATARAAWVDPATLERVEYSPLFMDSGEERPCSACGHPRWLAHSIPGSMWDGPCLVPECVLCDGRDGHAPGYLPGRPKLEVVR